MIAELSGKLSRIGPDFAIVNVGGVGYKVYAPVSVIADLPGAGGAVRFFTFTYVKEDILALYGFSDLDQQTVFELLLTVSGVGPKVALNILSVLPVENLVDAIATDDHHALVRIPGIGPKTAQRIVLELKEKTAELAWTKRVERRARPTERDILADVVEGLIGLGYARNDARGAAERAAQTVPDMTNTAAIVREALKLLNVR
ncbi:MAG: Holliday junction branch migration protein RuvA [Armatimonadota bacterium]|nr:Holliday junction branch migration protein RuvA [Armatimonadota bacterium]